jgi:hypothetical protein
MSSQTNRRSAKQGKVLSAGARACGAGVHLSPSRWMWEAQYLPALSLEIILRFHYKGMLVSFPSL